MDSPTPIYATWNTWQTRVAEILHPHVHNKQKVKMQPFYIVLQFQPFQTQISFIIRLVWCKLNHAGTELWMKSKPKGKKKNTHHTCTASCNRISRTMELLISSSHKITKFIWVCRMLTVPYSSTSVFLPVSNQLLCPEHFVVKLHHIKCLPDI